MRQRKWAVLVSLASIAFLAGCLTAQTPAQLIVHFEAMDPHVGQRLEARLVESETGIEVARKVVASIAVADFDLEFLGASGPGAYRLDIYADLSGNGAYDAPPTDHAWRVEIPSISGTMEITFIHNTTFVDIAWPTPSTGIPTIDGVIDSGEYANSFLEPVTGVHVYWRNDATNLTMGLVSPGTGWVAVGIDPEDAMQGADFILATVRNGTLVIEDHFGTGKFSHTLDLSQDIVESAGIEAGGQTIVEFTIPLDSGDLSDKRLRPGTTYPLLVALHSTSDDLATKHTKRAVAQLTLD